MAKKLYVGNLSYSTTDESLRAYFTDNGNLNVVSAQVLKDRDTGRSRGFGFVEMASDEEAEKAISLFNKTMFEGREISVNEARPQTQKPARTGGYDNRYGSGAGSYQ